MNDGKVTSQRREQLLLSGCSNFTVERTGILTCPRPKLGLRLEVDRSLSPLFPYLNGSVEGARYFGAPERIQFVHEEIFCTLYKREIIAAAFNDYDAAVAFGERFLNFLNGVFAARRNITPDFRTINPPAVLDVYKLLPKTNCKKCGYANCLAFAAALSRGKADSSHCPGFTKPIVEKAVYPLFDQDGNLVSTVEIEKNQSPTAVPLLDRTTEGHRIKELLTGREREVLRLLAEGASNPEISTQLSISPHTVKTHVGHIFDKLGVNDRTQAAVWASRHKIV